MLQDLRIGGIGVTGGFLEHFLTSALFRRFIAGEGDLISLAMSFKISSFVYLPGTACGSLSADKDQENRLLGQ